MYRVLYRKWRPRTFSDVVGQEHITSTLAHEVETDKISHAYLFTGSRGTGKTTCAKILAKAVNCLHPVNGNPCNECEICRGIDDGSILDVIEIDAASNNGVDNIRDLREEANYTPVHTKYRVYIIDEVHMLSIGAFNALLKTLEEPPEHVKFILATTEIHKLPATILSRCQRFDFHRIISEKITERLNFVAENEKIQLEPDASLLIARIADGALRDALSILDRCAGIDNHVTTETVTNAVGLAGKDYLFELTDNINNHNPSELLSIIDKLHSESCDMERLCTELISHFRNLMIIKTVKSPQNLIICTDMDFELYKKQAEKTSLSNILYCITELESCAAVIKNSSSKRIEMEMTIIKLSVPEVSDNISALSARIEALEKTLKNEKTTVSSENKEAEKNNKNKTTKKNSEAENHDNIPDIPKKYEYEKVPDSEESSITSSEASAENKTDDSLFTQWGDVLEKLNVTDKPLTGFLYSSTAYIRGDFLLIKCDNPVFSQFIHQASHSNAIKKAVFDVTGRKYRLGIFKNEENKENKNDPLADLINKINR